MVSIHLCLVYWLFLSSPWTDSSRISACLGNEASNQSHSFSVCWSSEANGVNDRFKPVSCQIRSFVTMHVQVSLLYSLTNRFSSSTSDSHWLLYGIDPATIAAVVLISSAIRSLLVSVNVACLDCFITNSIIKRWIRLPSCPAVERQ